MTPTKTYLDPAQFKQKQQIFYRNVKCNKCNRGGHLEKHCNELDKYKVGKDTLKWRLSQIFWQKSGKNSNVNLTSNSTNGNDNDNDINMNGNKKDPKLNKRNGNGLNAALALQARRNQALNGKGSGNRGNGRSPRRNGSRKGSPRRSRR